LVELPRRAPLEAGFKALVLVQKGFLPGKDQEREGFGKRVKSTEDGIRA